MRLLLLTGSLFLSFLLFAQPESATVKSISQRDNDLQIVLAINAIQNNNKLNQVKSVIASQSTFQLVASEPDFQKKTVEFYFKTSAATSIDQLERFIILLGILKLNYNGEPVEIESLSEVYIPIVPDEYVIKTRN